MQRNDSVLITGASSGIGAALAAALARQGAAHLFLGGRDAGRLADVAARCRAAGAGDVQAEAVDVTDAAAMRAWIARCDARAPLTRVFANAGVSTGEETEANVRRTFETNITGTLNTVLPVLALWESRPSPLATPQLPTIQLPTTQLPTPPRQLLLTASIAGYAPLAACPSYAATKACLKTWGLSLRARLAPRGIRVGVVCPGFVRSRITDRNTCPMPFFMEADAAARVILARADRDVGLIAFPWPMRLAVWGLSLLPWRLAEALVRALPRKTSRRNGTGCHSSPTTTL